MSYAGLSMRDRRRINVNKRGVDKTTANVSIQKFIQIMMRVTDHFIV